MKLIHSPFMFKKLRDSSPIKIFAKWALLLLIAEGTPTIIVYAKKQKKTAQLFNCMRRTLNLIIYIPTPLTKTLKPPKFWQKTRLFSISLSPLADQFHNWVAGGSIPPSSSWRINSTIEYQANVVAPLQTINRAAWLIQIQERWQSGNFWKFPSPLIGL